MEKIVKKIKLKNSLGLHTRPATLIVKTLQKFRSQVYFSYKKETADARSILALLMLGAHRNAHLTITVEGEDAQQAMESLIEVFDDKFGE